MTIKPSVIDNISNQENIHFDSRDVTCLGPYAAPASGKAIEKNVIVVFAL